MIRILGALAFRKLRLVAQFSCGLFLIWANLVCAQPVHNFAVSPAAPSTFDLITISFRNGSCDTATFPLVWRVDGSGSERDLVVDGIWDSGFCSPNAYGSLVPVQIGQLPPGEYTFFIRIRDRLSPFPPPLNLSERYGSVSFMVSGTPRTIPTMGSVAMWLLCAFLLILGMFVIGRSGQGRGVERI